MRLVERHIIKDNRFEDICLKSGLLYNYILYLVRQGIFNKEYLKEYDLSTKLGRENQFDFRNLPCNVSQQVVGQVFKSINSWIKLKRILKRIQLNITTVDLIFLLIRKERNRIW